jgi:hypothetical protein
MKTPKRNDREFLAQLRKSSAAFSAHQTDFAGYPLDLELYNETIAKFESAIAENERYETETLQKVAAAKKAYEQAVATARANLETEKQNAETEKVSVHASKKSARAEAENLFLKHQGIAESVYLGSDRDLTLTEFEVPSEKRTVRKNNETAPTNPVESAPAAA